MQNLFGILAVGARPYEYTHMVADSGPDLWDHHRCSLFERAALQEPASTDKSYDNIQHDKIHCNNNTTARDAPHRSRVHNTNKQSSIARADASHGASTGGETINCNTGKSISTIIAASNKSMRLRGGGGESQEHLEALTTLSENGSATFKRIVRKTFVMAYNEGLNMSDLFDTYSLTNINEEIHDDEVTDSAWDSYGARLTWAGDDETEADEDSYSEADDGDEYYDADEWTEGEVFIGTLLSWNDARNYGVIVVVDDYSPKWDMTSGEIFCHGTNFVDDDLDVPTPVWFTVTWGGKHSLCSTACQRARLCRSATCNSL